MKGDNICFIDFETTGTNLLKDYPIEIGAIVIDCDLEILNQYHSFIKPNNPFTISEQAFKIHGINKERLAKSSGEAMVLNEMDLLLGTNYRLAAWNMSFDVSFFKMFCYRNNFTEFLDKINYRHIDVQTISFVAKQIGLVDGRINSLSDFSYFLGLNRSEKHSALEDAKILLQVYKYLHNILSSRSKPI